MNNKVLIPPVQMYTETQVHTTRQSGSALLITLTDQITLQGKMSADKIPEWLQCCYIPQHRDEGMGIGRTYEAQRWQPTE